MVLDGVVGAPWEHFGHFSPFVAVGGVGQKENPLFMGHPFHFEDARVEVVVPTFSTLLAKPALNKFGNKRPPLRSVFFNEFTYQIVLLISPGLLLKEFQFVVF